jgi:hypothetical protein
VNIFSFPVEAISLATRAKMAALAAHEEARQTRKYGLAAYGPERYYFHPCRVAELVASVGAEEHVVAAAALHDVLEDVSPKFLVDSGSFSPEWLYREFGERVFRLVVECTNVYSKDSRQQVVLTAAVEILDRVGAPIPEYLVDLETKFMESALMNRAARKAAEAVRFREMSGEARIIKRADLFDNAASMHGAPADFVQRWMDEKDIIESYIGTWSAYVDEVQRWKERRDLQPS